MKVRRGPLLRISARLVLAWLLGTGTGAGAEELGRLFSTPEERDRLDLVRTSGKPAARSDSGSRAAPAQTTSRLSVNGLVMRERGPDAVWINGERLSRGERTREGIRGQGEEGARVRVILPQDAGVVRLKAGQQIDLAHDAGLGAVPAAGGPPGARIDAPEP